ncbi:MAG: TlpA family protein disulfide reductase [Candidatus Saganbacteria bacterium]|nr:TlpA family protein disulfide reductase [Candidatus Saganbacteria bacterium]
MSPCFYATMSHAMGEAPSKKAPDFTLYDLAGKSHTLSDYKGKVVFLNFWATWCPPCRTEMPAMQKLFLDSDKSKFVMLAVDINQKKRVVADFAKTNGYTFPILLDTNGKVSDKYQVSGIPATFIIDKSGNIVNRIIGSRHWKWSEFVPLINK